MLSALVHTIGGCMYMQSIVAVDRVTAGIACGPCDV